MIVCKGCSLIGCQRRYNPPPQCLPKEDRGSSGGYWPTIARMGREEAQLRRELIQECRDDYV